MDTGTGGCFSAILLMSLPQMVETSLAEAWRELRSNRVLREIMESNPCPDCALSEKCRGGCYAGSYRRYGVFNNPAPYALKSWRLR